MANALGSLLLHRRLQWKRTDNEGSGSVQIMKTVLVSRGSDYSRTGRLGKGFLIADRSKTLLFSPNYSYEFCAPPSLLFQM
jgi:hypothetical protein